MNYIVDDVICMSAEDVKYLRVIFPDLPLDELYAVHYIHSRQGNCSWMYIPSDKKDIESYRLEYKERIKPYLTQNIIDAINHCGWVGSDSVEYKGIGYNLDKIFHYWFFYGYDEDGGGDKPEIYVVEERKCEPLTNGIPTVAMNYITESYSENVLPFLCGGK